MSLKTELKFLSITLNIQLLISSDVLEIEFFKVSKVKHLS